MLARGGVASVPNSSDPMPDRRAKPNGTYEKSDQVSTRRIA